MSYLFFLSYCPGQLQNRIEVVRANIKVSQGAKNLVWHHGECWLWDVGVVFIRCRKFSPVSTFRNRKLLYKEKRLDLGEFVERILRFSR